MHVRNDVSALRGLPLSESHIAAYNVCTQIACTDVDRLAQEIVKVQLRNVSLRCWSGSRYNIFH